MSKPLVSVCIPVWNRERFLAATLESVLGQSYSELEVLVLDNASTDSSVEIAMRFAARDRRVRVVRNAINIGGMPNYRRLLELARGDYIKYCNSDDLLPPNLVARLVDGLEDPSVGLAFARQAMVDDAGRPLEPWLKEPLLPRDGILSGRELGDTTMMSSLNLIGCPTATLFRRRELPPEQFSQLVGEHFWVAGDLTSWLTLLAHRNAAYITSTPAVIRVHPQQETMSNPAIRVLSSTDWLTMALRAPAAGYLMEPAAMRVALGTGIRALAGQPDVVEPSEWSGTVLGGLARGAEALALLNSAPDCRRVLEVPLDFRRDPNDAMPMDGGGAGWQELSSAPLAV